jgi:hypothetical protein
MVHNTPGKDVPDGNEQLSGDDDNRLGIGHPASVALELGFPVREIANGTPGRLDEGSAQFAATGLGDLASAMGLAGVVDGSAQSGVGDQIIGRRETGDVSDGGQPALAMRARGWSWRG